MMGVNIFLGEARGSGGTYLFFWRGQISLLTWLRLRGPVNHPSIILIPSTVMLNNTSNDTTRDTKAGLSSRAVRLARRNMCKNTDEDRPGHASATSPASPPSASTPSPVAPSPVASPSSPPMICPELTSHSPTVPPTVVGFKSNDECIQERYKSAIQNGDVIVLEGSPVASTAVVDWSLPGETSKYLGAYKDGKWHGEGTYTYDDGEKYVGAWKDGKMHGQGTWTYPDGQKYVGAWKDDKRHGEGTYIWPDGRKYVVAWKDGKMHGQGTYIWANGEKYVGAWKDDQMHGEGTYTWPNGDKYDGADIGAKYDPITKEEVYEWNGVWYLVDGSGPAGQRWRGQGHGSDWRPKSEEEEEYEVWYKTYTANVLTRL